MAYHRWLSPYKKNNRFVHHLEERSSGRFLHSIISFSKLIFSKSYNKKELESWVIPYDSNLHKSVIFPHLTWIGHATFLIHVANKFILTDPVFGKLSHVINRLTSPGIPLESLPRIDAVLISHNHRDHMDEKTLTFLKKRDNPIFLVPEGTNKWFKQRDFKEVKEFNWWDKVSVFNGIRFTFLPAVHWSSRMIFDNNKSLWGSWMIESSDSNGIYFSGDTAYDTHFKEIAKQYPNIDFAIMGIGPTEPRELMKSSHLDPEEAGTAFLDLNAKIMVPMHWGTYRLGIENPLDCIKRLQSWWNFNLKKLSSKKLACLKFGEIVKLESQSILLPNKKPIIKTASY